MSDQLFVIKDVLLHLVRWGYFESQSTNENLSAQYFCSCKILSKMSCLQVVYCSFLAVAMSRSISSLFLSTNSLRSLFY